MDEGLIFNSEQSSHKDAKKRKREKYKRYSSNAALLPVSTVKIFTDMCSACVHNFKGVK